VHSFGSISLNIHYTKTNDFTLSIRIGTQHRIQHSLLYTAVDACGVTSTVNAEDVVIHQGKDF
jgi:hypothetical protein